MEENISELVSTLTTLVRRLEDVSTLQGVKSSRTAVDPDDAFDSEESRLKDEQKQQAKLNAEESEKLAKKKKTPRKILQTVMPIKVMAFDKKAIKQLQNIMIPPAKIQEPDEKPKKKSSWLPALLLGLGVVWDKLKDAWAAIRTTVGDWAKNMGKWWKSFKKKMGMRWTRLKSWFKSFRVSSLVPASIRKWWANFKKSASKRWMGIKKWFKNFKVSNLVPQSVRKWWQNTNKSMIKRWIGIKNWFKNFTPKNLIPQSIKNWWSKLNLSKRWTGVKSWFTNFSPKKLIPQSIRVWWSKLNFTKRWISIKSWFTNFSPSKLIPKGIRNWWKGFSMAKKWTSFKTFFVELPSKVKNLIPQSVRTALSGLVKLMKTALTPVTAMMSGLSGLFGGGKGAKGVSIFAKIAKFFGPSNPIIKGVFGFLKTAGKILGKIFLPITIITEAFNFITGFMKGFEQDGIIGGIREGVKSVFNSLVAWPLDLLKSGVSWIAGKLGFTEVEKMLDSFSFKDIFTDLFDKLFGVIDMGIGFIKNLISDGAEKVKDLFRSEEEKKARKAAGARAKNKEGAMKEAFGGVVSAGGMKAILDAKKKNEEAEADAIESQTERWRDAMAEASAKVRASKDKSPEAFEAELKKILGTKPGGYGTMAANMERSMGENWSAEALKKIKKVRGRDVSDKDALGDMAMVAANQRAQARRVTDTVSALTADIKKSGQVKLGDKTFKLNDMDTSYDPKIVEEYEKLVSMRDKTDNNELKIQYGALIKSLDKVGVNDAVTRIKKAEANREKLKSEVEAYKRAVEQGGPQRILEAPKELPSTNYELPQEERLKPWKLTPGPQPQPETRSLEDTKMMLQAVQRSASVNQKAINDQVKAAEEAARKSTTKIGPVVPMVPEQPGIDPNSLRTLDLTWNQQLPELDTKQAADHVKQSGDKINAGAQSLHFETLEGWPKPQSPYAWDYVKMAGENINSGSKQLYEQSIQYEKAAKSTTTDQSKETKKLSERLDKMVGIMSETADIQKKTLNVLEQHGLVDKQGNTVVNNGGNTTNVNNVTVESDIMSFRDRVVGRLYSK
jgi:hypothetical protein